MINQHIYKPFVEWSQSINTVSLSLVLPSQDHEFNVACDENYLYITVTDTKQQNGTLMLPLYSPINPQYTISQATLGFRLNLTLFKKRAFERWPRLLSVQGLPIDIVLTQTGALYDKYDTIDFDAVISGQGDKSGLEM